MSCRASTPQAAAGRERAGRRSWRELAVCAEVDPELFFPQADRGPVYEAQVAAAKRVCAVCPVQAECLSFALAALAYGIAGGMTAEERRALGRSPRPGIAALEETARTAPSRSQRVAAGRALLAAGRDVAEVAELCGVTATTARRWAARSQSEDLEVSA